MISFQNVSVQFPIGNKALDDVTFQIDKGEFVFFVGKSGAGKTTILNLLIQEYIPTEGSIVVNNMHISHGNFKKRDRYRQTIGVIFQDFKILPDRDVFENIALSLLVKSYPKDRIKAEVMEAVHMVGLLGKEEMFPAQLSAGELQRVSIARALVGDRNIIIADEPTGNLDPKTTWEIMKIFRKIESKRTVIIATHDTDIVNSLQKRVIVLDQGKVIKDKKKGGYEL